jgi:hypothetical protein
MMKRVIMLIVAAGFLLGLSSPAGDLESAVRSRSEGTLIEESVAAQQAAIEAKDRSGLSLELRPRVSNDEVGLGLRIYLPDRWSKKGLREQLALAAQSEQLRIAQLQWNVLISAYRDFCDYRMFKKQIALHTSEIEAFTPYLKKVNLRVQQRQFAATDQAKLYGLLVDLINDRESVQLRLIGIQRKLSLALGAKADLEALSNTAIVTPPTEHELVNLVQYALDSRADYRWLGVKAKALSAAEATARSEDGFRFKYIQPSYSANYDDSDDSSWALSAAFVLPWGARNPEIAVYQKERALALSKMGQQLRVLVERLQVLQKASESIDEVIEQRNQLILPLLEKLDSDLSQLDSVPLEQLRDLMNGRKRVLDSALETTKAERERERIAVDLAEELGTLGE